MKKRRIIVFSILAVVIIGIVIGVIVVKSYLDNYSETISNITITNVELSQVSDGTYTGSYEAFPVNVEVKVTIKDHKITGIDLVKHVNGQGAAAEILTEKVVEAQTLDIDVISGATASSKVILKAIENALNKS
jgi:uncharacterized protein with FMN-binding domain